MKKPFSKLIISVVVSAVLLYIASGTMVFASGFILSVDRFKDTESQSESLQSTLELLEIEEDSARVRFYQRTRTTTRLMSTILRDKVVNGRYTGQMLFDDGMVVRYANGKLEKPEGEFVPDLDVAQFEEALTSNSRSTRKNEYQTYLNTILTAEKIRDNYYYVDWTDEYELLNILMTSSNREGVLSGIEKAYNGLLLVADSNGVLNYKSGEFSQCETLEDCGLNEKNMENNSMFDIEDASYTVTYAQSNFTGAKLILLEPVESIADSIAVWTVVFSSISIVIILTMIIWNYAVQKLVFNNVLSEEQEKKYHPKRVRVVNFTAAIIGMIVVLISISFIQSMSNLYSATKKGRSALNILDEEINERKQLGKTQMNLSKEWYIYFGENIAREVGKNDDLLNREKFEEFKDILSIVYLMAYDENGNEICSSNDYINFTLGTEENDPTSDFRRLLHGIDSIVHDVAFDEYTGLNTQLLGVKIPLEGKEGYGALIMALYPYQAGMDITVISYDDRLRSLASSEDIMMIVDKESGIIQNCNIEELINYNISAFDIDPKESSDSLMNYFMINGNRYYGLAKETDEQIYYNFLSGNRVSQSFFGISLVGSIIFVLIYALGMFLINRGYNEKVFNENVLIGAPVIRGSKIEIETVDGRKKNTVDPSKRFAFIPEMWREMLPERKAILAFDIMVSIFLIQIIYYVYIKRTASDSLLGFIMQGKWSRGINLFAITSIVILVAGVTLTMMVVKLVFYLMIMTMDTKGETVCRLTYNLLQYVAFITVLYYAFGYLGFNTSGLLASVGFVTLAISLGSKDLVADILAGLTIVFEGEYQVGDMVEIGGYRGKVQEIGVRSTKLIGRGDNIKIIGNRDVKNVLNMTRLNSWLPIEVTIPASESLDKVEAILDEQLPQIGKQIKEIIRGPYYYGVLAINKGNMTLSILTECREEDYHKVQRKLNKELLNLFKQNNIPMT